MATFILLLFFSAFPPAEQSLTSLHVTLQMSQSNAREACKTNYTDLVTVYSDEDNTALAKLAAPAGSWIGLYRNNQPSNKWSNGDDVGFSNLIVSCASGPCCAAMKANGSWESLQCTDTRSFMCYKKDVTDLSYHFISKEKNWYEAQLHCRNFYTDLVSIRDQNQNEAVMREGKISTTSFWIGLLSDDWEWTDGGRSAYRNWMTGQPLPSSSSPPPDCVIMLAGKWISTHCTSNKPALCYRTLVHVSKEGMSWEDAQDYCNKENRTGLRITSDLDQKVLEFELRRKNISGSFLWLGLRQSRLFGFWFWFDQTVEGPNNNWVGGNPPEPPLSHYCAAIDAESFKWLDKDCRSKFRALCAVK